MPSHGGTVALLCALSALSPSVDGAVDIAAGRLRVRVDVGAGRFQVSQLEAGRRVLSDSVVGVAGKVKAAASGPADSPLWGPGQEIRFTDAEGNAGCIAVYDALPFVLLRRTLVNDEAETKRVAKTPMLVTQVDIGSPTDRLTTMSTAGLRELAGHPGSYSFLALADRETRSGIVCGFLSHDRGDGVIFTDIEGGLPVLRARIDYGDLRIPAGERYATETLLVGWFDDVRAGLEAYATAVATYEHVRMLPQPVVYCTWYHAGASDEQRLARTAAFASEHLKPYGFSVVQIDDKWQSGTTGNGPRRNFTAARPDGPYPSGMKATADRLRALGLVPGIWFMPFAGTWNDPFFADKQDLFYKKDGKPYEVRWGGTCLDLTNPATRKYVRSVVHRIAHEWGFRYFKLDGLWTGTGTRLQYVNSAYRDDDLGEAIRHTPSITPIEAYRTGLQLVREAAGNEVFLLGCCANQNMRSFGSSFGLVNAMRVGPDNGARPESMTRGPTFAGRVYFLNGRVWWNDPDPVYVRPSFPKPMAQSMVSWTALTSSLHSSSYDYGELPAERLYILQRSMPSHGLLTVRPVDYLDHDPARVWHLWDESRGVRRDVVGLFNWDVAHSATVAEKMARLELPDARAYVGFDYWGNRFVPPLHDTVSATLPPGGCAVLSLRPVAEHPIVVGTSRHVTQGIIDLLDEEWNAGAGRLRGRSRLIGGETYEIRIIVPVGEESWQAAAASAASHAGATVQQSGPTVRLSLESPRGGDVDWEVAFRRGAVEAPPVRQVAGVEAEAEPWEVRLRWQEQPAAVGYRVRRRDDHGVETWETTAPFLRLTDVQLGARYTFVVQARGWVGDWSPPVETTVQMPADYGAPPQPPAPTIPCTSLKPLRATCGWGKLHFGKSVSGGPLRIDGREYEDGIGTHAPSTIVYRVPQGARRFVALVGLDDAKRTDDRPTVIFCVSGEVKEMGEEPVVLAESPLLRARGPRWWAFDIALDERMQEVSLIVDATTDGKAADHADWVNVGFITD